MRHLNCVSSCPLGGRLMDGRSRSVLQRGQLCCHCLLVESNDGLVLVDTGFGLRDVAHPRSRLSGFFLALLSPDFREEMTAIRQVQALGFKPTDVRHIVLTHLDFDHAGGLDDFPHAHVHLLQRERDHAVRQTTWLDRQRFRPQQWSTQPRWHLHGGSGGESWMGSTASARATACRKTSRWCRCPATPSGMPAWRCAIRAAGSCRQATPTSTTARWITCTPGAHPGCASTRR